ncbi:glutamate--tRNA ligase [Anaerolineales bacterium HSG25]|nr:glutamate--tRNA ligase [Anaerolineales bacterium HSG25]
MTLNPNVRVRYAPSPTGDFHVGGARTALFNYLFARHHGGSFILRIEDTDQKRFNPEALDWLLNGLRYLGLEWDEGPDVGGEFGPYTQTERLDIYQRHCQQLLDEGKAYRCFCTAERLDAVRKEQQKNKQRSGYDRHCRNLDPTESAERANNGEQHTVRIKLPLAETITFQDKVKGKITFDYTNLQDAVIMKSDGIPTYHLANVIDDHLMQISHIMRGDEWVNSIPLHLLLYQSFGWQPPVMVHLPLILNPTGKGKMSKREGRAPDGRVLPVFVRSFEEMGYLPEAMINYLALLGWSLDDKTEIFSKIELIEHFSLERIKPSPAAWDYDRLDHFNGDYIRQLSVEALTEQLLPFLEQAGISATSETLSPITPIIQERIKTLSDAASQVDFFFVENLPDYDSAELIPKKMDAAQTITALQEAKSVLTTAEFEHDALDSALRTHAKSVGLKVGQMFQPIRVAVCGRKAAPPLLDTLAVLGRETCLKRIDQAIESLNR